MLTRRLALAAPLAAIPRLARAQGGFATFLDGVRAEASRAGVSAPVLNAALSGLRPNPQVLQRDQHQPEFTLTWAQYKARVLPPKRLQAGRAAYAAQASLLASLVPRYPADPRIMVAIWGLESNFGGITGTFGIVDALATLAYHGRRASFFRAELIDALRILQAGDITPAGMTGSWAGAMGQPQFMPSAYLRYAVDGDGDGKRDIWTDQADILGSIGNYLARHGWQPGAPWGQPVRVPASLATQPLGRDLHKTLGAWESLGVRRFDGTRFSRTDVPGAVLMPDGPQGEAYMVYANFQVIRRYNPSDYYALAVGLLGDAVA